jgi:Mg/Co/Ni transporter MgtE
MDNQSDLFLINQFLLTHPLEAVRLIEHIGFEDIAQLLEGMTDLQGGQILGQLDRTTSINCLRLIKKEKACGIVENLPIEIAANIMKNSPEDFRKSILQSISKVKSDYLIELLKYPDGTVGSLMDPVEVYLFEDYQVAEALRILKRQSKIVDQHVFIISRNQKLVGVISLGDLLLSNSDKKLDSIMKTEVTKIFADVKLSSIINHPGWNENLVLPVVDGLNILQGKLRYTQLKRHETGNLKKGVPHSLVRASGALGELYRLGLASLIQGASEFYTKHDKVKSD